MLYKSKIILYIQGVQFTVHDNSCFYVFYATLCTSMHFWTLIKLSTHNNETVISKYDCSFLKSTSKRTAELFIISNIKPLSKNWYFMLTWWIRGTWLMQSSCFQQQKVFNLKRKKIINYFTGPYKLCASNIIAAQLHSPKKYRFAFEWSYF